jgi:cytochrome c oxidase subunit 3
VILGAGQWINGTTGASIPCSSAWPGGCLCCTSGSATPRAKAKAALYGRKIDLSYRWSMSWFIFSEVMFFGAFFTALWWARVHSVPALGSLDNALLWPDFKAVWPSVAAGATASPAGIVEPFQTMGPSGCPPSTPRCC